MKTKTKIRPLITLLVLFYGTSCTKNFDEINTNPYTLTSISPDNLPAMFNNAISYAIPTDNLYQEGQNLFADMYAQYWANINPSFASDRFMMNQNWINSAFGKYYVDAAVPLSEIMKSTDPQSAEYALASIMWVYQMHNITDQFGPIPYFLTSGQDPLTGPFIMYDAQDTIYDDFFQKLESADLVLKSKTDEIPYGSSDIIYGGNVILWNKFANSLRLRLALRISEVDPVRAKKEAEAAVEAGVFQDSPEEDAQIIRYRELSALSHHLSVMSQWGEFVMSASMESYLKGYKDPRMDEWFSPTKNTDPARTPGYTGFPEYNGIRNGLLANDFNESINHIDENSIPGFRWNNWLNPGAYQTPQNIMCAAEVYFLRAEGALNGWNMGGEAEEFYEAGIRNSFQQWGIKDDPEPYIHGIETPIPPEDYLSSPAVADVPVAFGPSEEIQREQIGIQKWLSTFPEGFVGWADQRRTGYPKLYPVVNSDNDDLDPGSTIRRLEYPNVEYYTNKTGIEGGLLLLNGPDKASTRLWWNMNNN